MIAFNSWNKVKREARARVIISKIGNSGNAADAECLQWYVNELKFRAERKETQLGDSSTKQTEAEKFLLSTQEQLVATKKELESERQKLLVAKRTTRKMEQEHGAEKKMDEMKLKDTKECTEAQKSLQ
jgi:hypothetical protein